jgi:hypothetical protein
MAREIAEFSAKVPREEYEFFRDTFPQYGASTWFITSALVEFNARLRENPSLKEHVDRSIDAMLQLNRALSEEVPAA